MRILADHYAETADPVYPRDTGWIGKLLGDFVVPPPGTTCLADWRPEPGLTGASRPYRVLYGGVGRKA